MAKKSNKKIIIWSILIVLAIFIIIAIVGFILAPEKNISYFFDKDLGVIKINIFKQNIFQQAVRFPTDKNYSIGEKVIFEDFVECFDRLLTQTIVLKKPDGTNLNIYDDNIREEGVGCFSETFRKSIEFTPDKAGIWTATSTYYNEAGEATIEQSVNTLVVKSVIPTCDADPGWGDYTQNETISNGAINVKNYYSWSIQNNQCIKIIKNIEYQTKCNSGYVIEGTNDNIASDKKKCVLAQNKNDSQSDCNGDLLIKCQNNSTILDSQCVSGKLVSMNNTCPQITNETTSTNTTTDRNNQTVETCYRINLTSNSCYSANNFGSCINNSYATLATCEIAIPESGFDILLIVSIILGVLALGAIIFMVIRFTRSK